MWFVETGTIPGPAYKNTVPSNPAQEVSSHVSATEYSAEYSKGNSIDLQGSLSVFLHLQYSDLLTLAACVSLGFKQHLLNSESLPFFTWFPTACMHQQSKKSLQLSKLGNHKAHFVFISQGYRCVSLLDLQGLENCCFTYFCPFFSCGQEGKSCQCYFNLARSFACLFCLFFSVLNHCEWHLIQSSLMDWGQILHGYEAAPQDCFCVGLFTNHLKGSHSSV